MTDQPVQIVARGPRADAEAAARDIDAHPVLEAVTYSILEEDEDKGVWRIDAFPTSDDEASAFTDALKAYPNLQVTVEALADADWLPVVCFLTDASLSARMLSASSSVRALAMITGQAWVIRP